ncbi:MAG: hypothetical protein QM768_01975 [Agriterribacter sp.]
MHTHTFTKEPSGWYIELPEYIAQGGNKGDLAMVDGADTMLDIIAEDAFSITLTFDDKEFDGADKIILIEKCDPYIGGGNYIMPQWENKIVNQRLWLCAVTEFVFGYIPETIFVKREASSI